MKKLLLTFLVILLPSISFAAGLKSAMETSASAMRAQSERIKVITENIANSDNTGINSNEDPYRRKTIFFEEVKDKDSGTNLVKIKKIDTDKSEFKLLYMPNHPAANADGYIKTPNVDRNLESMDLREAQRSYEANVTAIENSKQMMDRTLDLLR
jgi:flagellar basal-body rod protein FlgC